MVTICASSFFSSSSSNKTFSLELCRAHIFYMFCLQTLALDAAAKRKYLEHFFRKCLRIKGVQNAIVFNSIGVPKHSTFEHGETIRSIGLFDDLILKVNIAIHMTNPDDQFVSIRLRTHKFEIFISKDLDDIYFVIFQNAKGKCKLLCILTQIASLNLLTYQFPSTTTKKYIHTDTHSQLTRRIEPPEDDKKSKQQQT